MPVSFRRRRGTRIAVGLLFVGVGLYAVGALGASIGSRKAASVAEYEYPGVTLTSSPESVPAGGTSTLSWTATDVTSCTANGDWSGSKPLSGSQIVSAWGWERGFYELFCDGPEGPAFGFAEVRATSPVTVHASTDQRQVFEEDGSQEDAFAQTFTVGISGWLTDINIFGGGANPYDQVAITRTTPSGAPDSSKVLTSTTMLHQGTSGGIRLPKPIFVLAGQRLAITVIAPNGRTDPSSDYVFHVYACGDPYPRGSSYDRDQNGAWTELTGCDVDFATYVVLRLKIGP
jgi:hypothetical protein